MKKAIRKNWESILQASQSAQQKQDALANLFSSVTNIEIPIPQNPLFSIFGKNYVRFQITGGIDIHAAFQNVKSDLYTTTVNQSTSTPEFSQQLQFTLNGEVGDKLKVSADWNTQRTFDYENQMHINYRGYDDDIIQSVEAGNVSLQTNSSFISSSQALFGIKMGMQFGPLKLTAIASQKKGQIKSLSVNSGSSSTTFNIRPSQYSQNYYFIDTSYIGLYGDWYLGKNHVTNHPEKTVQYIEVWVSRIGAVSTKEKKVIAFMSQDSVLQYQKNRPPASMNYSGTGNGEMEAGAFVPLINGTDYTINQYIGVISLKTALQTNQAIAVAYTAGPLGGPTTTIGNSGSQTTGDSSWLVMKLVRPLNLASNPFLKTGWKMMLKSHYAIGGGGISANNFSMKIQYQPSGETAVDNVLSQNIGVMTMLGMDRYNGPNNDNGPDKIFDYIPDFTVDSVRGEIIFPTVQPFDSASIAYFLASTNPTLPSTQQLTSAQITAAADSLNFNNLYDTTASAADVDPRSRYIITGTATSSVQSQYSVGTNIVEGSVVVTVDGQPAVLNTDYTVDYVSGTITIRNPSFLTAGRNVQIKYEANDLFQLASKTLLGVRGEIAINRSTALGFTVMNLNEQSLTDKVRLGDEPTNNTIYGLDASTSFDAPFLTKILNWLPGIHTIEKSRVSLKGEYAYMSPDPNTRTSPVPEDGGKSVAYIDDFEGSLQTMPISVAYTSWKEASPPYYISTIDTAYAIDGITKTVSTDPVNTIMADTDKMEYKAHTTWFTIASSDVQITDIWGSRRQAVSGQSQVTVLNMYFDPAQRGTYNYSQNLFTKLFLNPTKAWGGAQLALGTSTTNLADQNINYIQMWVKIVAGQPTVKLNIDLGYISEKSYPLGGNTLMTEDGLDNHGIPTGLMHQDEDAGIDELSDDQEKHKFSNFRNAYAGTRLAGAFDNDPSGDDWKQPPTSINGSLDTGATAISFDGCNGVEGNYQSELGSRYPDTEDLNGDGIMNPLNSYFEYELPLDTNNAVFAQYVTGVGNNGWHQVSIPLEYFTRQIGSPTLTDIQDMRIWVTGASGKVLFRIANFNLVGNQWRTEIPNDPVLQVSAVNYQDNPDYTPPVPLIVDPTITTQTVYENEQSLDLIISNLQHGDSTRAVKLFGA
ncbi:MAG: cell surface protein SprA, partial [Bacteroidota bacterium]